MRTVAFCVSLRKLPGDVRTAGSLGGGDPSPWAAQLEGGGQDSRVGAHLTASRGSSAGSLAGSEGAAHPPTGSAWRGAAPVPQVATVSGGRAAPAQGLARSVACSSSAALLSTGPAETCPHVQERRVSLSQTWSESAPEPDPGSPCWCSALEADRGAMALLPRTDRRRFGPCVSAFSSPPARWGRPAPDAALPDADLRAQTALQCGCHAAAHARLSVPSPAVGLAARAP